MVENQTNLGMKTGDKQEGSWVRNHDGRRGSPASNKIGQLMVNPTDEDTKHIKDQNTGTKGYLE